MNKIIKNMLLILCTIGVMCLLPVFLLHDAPIPVDVVRLDMQELAAQKEAVAKAEKQARSQARVRRVYSCSVDEDCIIVEKDPCGCTIGPSGVTAINVNHILDFNSMNNQKSVTKTCPEQVSKERECSPSARPVCKAKRCSISY
ncbi:MAG: hypothetical protein J6Y17_02320 [Elusimicrobiaceae bacterium]|nr:hypothetical protein [Elusimicrobiaceae bacterium]